jgi:16S rRNA (cytosine967-C5)-methyltransferase
MMADSVAPARACAFAVIQRVFEHGAYADRAFHAEAAGLEGRDRALAMVLAYGTVQRRRTLDHLIAALCSRPIASLAPALRDALRLGMLQIALLDGVAEHAAVNDSVELAKASTPAGAKLVNAVLRRATREARPLLAELDDETPERAAILHSVPDWIAELWWSELGPDRARALLRTVNLPAESALRVNTLRADVQQVLARLDVPVDAASGLPEGLVLRGPFDAHASELWQAGMIMPQSRGSMTVAREAAPRPGERVLDLCAAPGGKTTHLAALLQDRSPEFAAVEVHPGRARALERTCERMGATGVRVVNADGREPPSGGPFDTVLVDPPCSGLGTLQSRPDLRWQARRSDLEALVAKQTALLLAGAAATASDGVLVYSVCTISRAESEGVLTALLTRFPEFELERQRQLTPDQDGTDGFFIARLRRR